MAYSETETETYSVADVETVMRRVSSDLIMISNSTGAISEQSARDYAFDFELLAQKGYLKSVDVTLLSGTTEIRAVRYDLTTDSKSETSRPGGVLWPRVESPRLRIVLRYTDAYTDTAKANTKPKLRNTWVPNDEDTNHSALTQAGGRDYSSNGFGMHRKDYSK